jgi:hypothetical protein
MLRRRISVLGIFAAVFITGIFCFAPSISASEAGGAFVEVKRFKAAEANQGVAVDEKYFYAIDNTQIGKYDKNTGALVAKWEGSAEYPAIHFDGGVVLDGKLYVPHSDCLSRTIFWRDIKKPQ